MEQTIFIYEETWKMFCSYIWFASKILAIHTTYVKFTDSWKISFHHIRWQKPNFINWLYSLSYVDISTMLCCPFLPTTPNLKQAHRWLCSVNMAKTRAVKCPQNMSSEMCISYHTPSLLSRTNTNIYKVRLPKLSLCTCEI